MIKNYHTYIKEKLNNDDYLEEEDELDDFDDDFITDIEFKKFLIEKGCLEQYIRNCNNELLNNDYNGSYLTDDPETYIVDSFWWGGSPEGYDYWSDLNGEWLNYIKY